MTTTTTFPIPVSATLLIDRITLNQCLDDQWSLGDTPSRSHLLALERIHQVDSLANFINQPPGFITVEEIQERFNKLMQETGPGLAHKASTLCSEPQSPTLKSNNPFLPPKREPLAQSFASRDLTSLDSLNAITSSIVNERPVRPSERWYQEYRARFKGTIKNSPGQSNIGKTRWPDVMTSDSWKTMSTDITIIDDASGVSDQNQAESITSDDSYPETVTRNVQSHNFSQREGQSSETLGGSTVFIHPEDIPRSMDNEPSREGRDSLSSESSSWCQTTSVNALPSPTTDVAFLQSSSSPRDSNISAIQVGINEAEFGRVSDTVRKARPGKHGKSASRAKSASQGTSLQNPQSSTYMARSNSSKRRHSNNDNDEDGEDQRRQPVLNTAGPVNDLSKPRLGCPYYLKSPTRYHRPRSCAGPGWYGIHRLK
jgi:hypothetical protein